MSKMISQGAGLTGTFGETVKHSDASRKTQLFFYDKFDSPQLECQVSMCGEQKFMDESLCKQITTCSYTRAQRIQRVMNKVSECIEMALKPPVRRASRSEREESGVERKNELYER